MRSLSFIVLLLIAFIPSANASNINTDIKKTGLKLPRFVSLKSDEVNMRAGPGLHHPVTWVYQRKNMPIQIIDEYDDWRKVKDIGNNTGWMHKAMLSGRRTGVVKKNQTLLIKKDSFKSFPIMSLENNSIIDINKCDSDECRVSAGDVSGWIKKAQIWGIYKHEVIE